MTLDDLVKSYIADKGEPTLHKYIMYNHFAKQAHKELRLGMGQDNKLAELTLASNKTVQFPSDMVKWNRIGLLVGDRLAMFDHDASIMRAVPQDTPNDSYVELFDFLQGTNWYGVGYNGVGYFQEDRVNSRFVFSSEVTGDKIYLEYIADETITATSLIKEVAEQAYKAYMDWKMARMQGNANAEAQMSQIRWQQEKDLAKKRLTPFTLDEIWSLFLEKSRGIVRPFTSLQSFGQGDDVDTDPPVIDPPPGGGTGIFDDSFDATFE